MNETKVICRVFIVVIDLTLKCSLDKQADSTSAIGNSSNV